MLVRTEAFRWAVTEAPAATFDRLAGNSIDFAETQDPPDFDIGVLHDAGNNRLVVVQFNTVANGTEVAPDTLTLAGGAPTAILTLTGAYGDDHYAYWLDGDLPSTAGTATISFSWSSLAHLGIAAAHYWPDAKQGAPSPTDTLDGSVSSSDLSLTTANDGAFILESIVKQSDAAGTSEIPNPDDGQTVVQRHDDDDFPSLDHQFACSYLQVPTAGAVTPGYSWTTADSHGHSGVVVEPFVEASAFTDDFNRANENLEASGDWTRVGGSAGDATISSNVVAFHNEGSVGAAYLCPDQGTANHYTQIVRQVGDVQSEYFDCCVRTTDGNNFIGCRWRVFDSEWQLYKRVSGTFTLLGTSATPTPAGGDVVRVEANGDQITVLVDGSPIIGPVTETDHQSVTRQGFVARNDAADPVLDDFEAGVL